ncbi:hypothetical protein Syun_005278 [Stephania yunnanensis]|uniref:Gamma-tubulin complex component n=1 Tax=Stephania yunnanensis TaxID=152371 RepID=A0AAP0L4T1_9MAGN
MELCVKLEDIVDDALIFVEFMILEHEKLRVILSRYLNSSKRLYTPTLNVSFHFQTSMVYISFLVYIVLASKFHHFILGSTFLRKLKLRRCQVQLVFSLQEIISPETLKRGKFSVNTILLNFRDVWLEEKIKLVISGKFSLRTLSLSASLFDLADHAHKLLLGTHESKGGSTVPCVLSSSGDAVRALSHIRLILWRACLVNGISKSLLDLVHLEVVIYLYFCSLLAFHWSIDMKLFQLSLKGPSASMLFLPSKYVGNDLIKFDLKGYMLYTNDARIFRIVFELSQTFPLDSLFYHSPSQIPTLREIRGELPKSFIDKLHCIFAKDLPFAGPVSALRTNEFEVVCSALFLWDDIKDILKHSKSKQLVVAVCIGLITWIQVFQARVRPFLFYPEQDPALISLQGRDQNSIDLDVCPLFLKDMAKAIVSAGKSLQLVQHIPIGYFTKSDGVNLAGGFCLSLVGLIGDGSLISKYFGLGDSWDSSIIQLLEEGKKKKVLPEECVPDTSSLRSEHIWCKFLVETMVRKGIVNSRSLIKDSDCLCSSNEGNKDAKFMDEPPLGRSFCPENPVLTVCQTFLERHTSSGHKLNVSRNFCLPALDDEDLRQAIFSGMDEMPSVLRKTNYMFGFQYGESGYTRLKDDLKAVETLYPFPTLLPPFQESLHIPELFPSQENSTLASRVLNWLQGVVTKATPLPAVIMQDCLIVYIKKQVDCVGKHILLKLMNDWKLVDELAVLRAIYLLGSGDLLQQFLTMLFNKLDKGESWDDEFELNTLLQESIRNSADAMLLNAFDSLVVSITRQNDPDGTELHNTGSPLSTSTKGRNHCFGINALDLLNFTYKVSWPLELIANTMALKKYNQVMCFLLRVKRAKFVLDKARRWMWKGKGTSMMNLKRHWLVEQKLLHFVDAFHQYVMDRVLHSSWLELCEGMASAGSLDEVIEVHEAYLLSIQRQCFVVPDKLWALIASRINSILGLALDFYSIQQTLSSGGAAPAIKARCEIEVDRIEKQFDDCIAFLLRVLSFKLNVGHFPHLADLVTRINYNYFYMSDSGNLLTVPGSESGLSKMGKGIPVRHDP